jgi:hypothetical protein
MIVNCKSLLQNWSGCGSDKRNNPESRKRINHQNKKPITSRINVLYFLEQTDTSVIP